MPKNQQLEEQFSDIDHVPLSVIDHMSGYWRIIAERKKQQHDVSISRIILGQLITIVVVALSGLLIEERMEAFLLVGSTLLLYPALTDLLMSSGSVLSTNIHHDLERQDESTFRYSLLSLIRSATSTTAASLVVGIVAGIIGVIAFDILFFDTLKLAVIATGITVCISLPIVVVVTLVVRNSTSNPDEIVPALESSLFNTIVLLAIAATSRWFL